MFTNCLLDGDYISAGFVDQEARPLRLAAVSVFCYILLAVLGANPRLSRVDTWCAVAFGLQSTSGSPRPAAYNIPASPTLS